MDVLHGSVGSMDGFHIVMESCDYLIKKIHMGPKGRHNYRAYIVTVNHWCLILSFTTGNPSRWNDKMVIMYNNLSMSLINRDILQDFYFELYQTDTEQNKYCGAWVIVNNGFLKCPVTIPLQKHSTSRIEIRWSEWMSFMRKDVKCTFGFLKGKFHILKTRI